MDSDRTFFPIDKGIDKVIEKKSTDYLEGLS